MSVLHHKRNLLVRFDRKNSLQECANILVIGASDPQTFYNTRLYPLRYIVTSQLKTLDSQLLGVVQYLASAPHLPTPSKWQECPLREPRQALDVGESKQQWFFRSVGMNVCELEAGSSSLQYGQWNCLIETQYRHDCYHDQISPNPSAHTADANHRLQLSLPPLRRYATILA